MSSKFEEVKLAPPDPILGINIAFNADQDPRKVNLGVGAYRTDDGKPYVLEVVKKAEKIILEKQLNKEYAPIDGTPEFKTVSQKLMFGENSPALKENRIATTQSLSGTGALRIGAEFIKKYFPSSAVYISDPTWGNHDTIFGERDIKIVKYRYFDSRTNDLDLNGMLDDLKAAPNNSVVLLHVCAHNPTGVDPTKEQWKQIAQVCQEKNHLPFFDCAYQGYATGDIEGDAFSVKYFVELGFEALLAQSFAKNLGLYGERIGAFSVVCKTADGANKVLSQLKLIVRPMYSNPPLHGARIVATILSDESLYKEWAAEVKMMSNRIIDMRKALYDILQEKKTPGDWSHILKQIGMFTYTGLKPEQVEKLITNFHIHMMKNGRISMAGLNSKNVRYVAEAFHTVVTESPTQKL
jgi:aspartate aminotransferase